jgi:predicted Zn-dependent protease
MLAAAQGTFAQGATVDEGSMLKTPVPAAELEQAASQQHAELLVRASAKRALAPDGDALVRLRTIAQCLIPNASRFKARARQRKWEANLIGSKQIDALCMPDGKIAFVSGLLDTPKLADDEFAVVMRHEIAHAVREHARARIAKNPLTQLGARVPGSVPGGGRYADLFLIGSNLLTLKLSREDENDADFAGLDIAARSGYDPRAGITL